MDDSTMVVLLPVFQPGYQLVELCTRLREAAPEAPVTVVDDGSGTASGAVLDAVAERGALVVHHEKNRGKGAALKTGLARIADAWPGRAVVCADADGQHRVADILRVGGQAALTGRLTLGVRRFDTAVPVRSRVGNAMTAALFRAATGIDLPDTQTGLRAFPAGLLPWLASIPGERFEYEMNVLLAAARDGHPIDQVAVTTTYLAGNASSHFGSVEDSLRVYGPLLRQVLRAAVPAAGRG